MNEDAEMRIFAITEATKVVGQDVSKLIPTAQSIVEFLKGSPIVPANSGQTKIIAGN